MEGNQNALVHGGAAAEKNISRGEPFHGIAAEAQAEVSAEYQEHGAHFMVTGNAERLEAASRLYWHAITKAAEAGDIATMDKYLARFGWLAGKAVSAWAEVRKGDKKRGNKAGLILEAIKNDKG